MTLSTSIVLCTDGRRDSLKVTLESLRFLNCRRFEVCVVCGPTEDGTRELLSGWPDPLKVDFNPERNLSVSRNLGIRLAAGDVVAFLDDDSVPEPEWLDQILEAYDDEKTGGAGGFVYDHTGMAFQWRYGTADRLGEADLTLGRATPEYNFPFSYNFPHLLGANSTFRRRALVDVQGFDEEFEYFLDETDLICRIIDSGWSIAQLDNAFVHHKYLSSHIRDKTRVIRSWYSVFKNKLYFGLVNSNGYHSKLEVIKNWQAFVQKERNSCDWAVSEKLLTSDDRLRFDDEASRALVDGFERAAKPRRFMPPAFVKATPPEFTPYFVRHAETPRRTICLLTREYGPGPVGGVARYVQELAETLAAFGNQIHVITNVSDSSRVDFENGVWVHRLVPPAVPTNRVLTDDGPLPDAIAAACEQREAYLLQLASRKPIDAVYSPVWDCEGAAILRSGRFPVVVGLQTTMAFWLDSHPEKRGDQAFMRDFGRPILALEKEFIGKCHAVHVISNAIGRDVEEAYGLSLTGRSEIIPLGVEDTSTLPRGTIPPRIEGVNVRLLFVGRLEARKGIDVLLSIAPCLLTEFPRLQIDIVGNDRIGAGEELNYRSSFEEAHGREPFASRIRFHGEVGNNELRGFYSDCDIFVSPSRYESFGLVFVEAMMYAKPVVGCSIGGMVDVIVSGNTGLLTPPGDAEALLGALRRLIGDKALRAEMGEAGRRRYEQLFRRESMALGVSRLLDQARAVWAKENSRNPKMA